MERFLRTPLFFGTELVPRDARYTYGFVVTESRLLGANATIRASYELSVRIDPLNSATFDGRSALAMPSAPPQPEVVRADTVPHGSVSPASLESLSLKEIRPLTVYTPPGHESRTPSDLLIVLDGEDYDGGSAAPVSVPTILDNLVAAGKVPPTVAVFVKNVGHRVKDLADAPAFADFVGLEILPWARKTYRIAPGASHVVVAGASLGGLAASYCAVVHSEAIGNVISLSGSYWITKDWENRPPFPLTLGGDTGDLIGVLRKSRRLPLAFYVAVGRFEVGASMLGTNRELRDVLLLEGYPVTFREVGGGHDNIWWRSSLADGLVALLGHARH
jgi:enterochelin esterase family protein